ncbi:MAG: hypothetical protein HOE45_12220 [Gammaproteobacteria bacterium]|nr:hypothetical protein [Gammaproteobacteria bacterium]MBT6575136.1 hypothetical protein [Gammaproteobacteria bacterium]
MFTALNSSFYALFPAVCVCREIVALNPYRCLLENIREMPSRADGGLGNLLKGKKVLPFAW